MIFRAISALHQARGITVQQLSSLVETLPIGLKDQPPYVNAVAEIGTTLSPENLLETLRSIETSLGRVRQRRWDARLIDLDILLYDRTRMNTPHLTLPHPEIPNRPYLGQLLRQLNAPSFPKTHRNDGGRRG